MKTSLLAGLCTLFSLNVYSQWWEQHFDGADTNWNSITVDLDTNENRDLWQIGFPEKSYFYGAYSEPHAIITDTAHTYPLGANEFFELNVPNDWSWGIFALQWVQKLDMDSCQDAGIIEYSIDMGTTWTNVFFDPYVYDFYGFDWGNYCHNDSLDLDGFTGTDSLWNEIWLCFDYSFLSTATDTVQFRFTFHSDSTQTVEREGWVMDSFIAHITGLHTIVEQPQEEYMKIYPTPANDRLNIHLQEQKEFHIIESMHVLDQTGRILKSYETVPTKFWIELDDLPEGNYFLQVNSNLQSETQPFVISR